MLPKFRPAARLPAGVMHTLRQAPLRAATAARGAATFTTSAAGTSSTPAIPVDDAAPDYSAVGRPAVDEPWKWRDVSAPRTSRDQKRRSTVSEILRVDHAGETAAVAIYRGQAAALAVTGESTPETAQLLLDMEVGEQVHLVDIEAWIRARRARPSALLPVWAAAGWGMGFISGLLGEKAAMACTVAVEQTIGKHYDAQIETLQANGWDEPELTALLAKNRDEELEHLNTGLQHDAEGAPMYNALSAAIQSACKAGIEVSRRV